SLEGGYDGYFSRRSSKFRSNMRRARKKADEEGVESVYLAPDGDEVDEVFDRILAIEQHSWKAENNSGIATGPMRKFYGQMVPMLAEDDKLRVAFVQTDDTDIAYCFGGLFEDLYRGLQLSYHDDYSDLSPGNLAQQAGEASREDLVALQQAQEELNDLPVMQDYLEAQETLVSRLETVNEAISEPLVIDFGG
ncbi:MAG: GNAT family N-acetyltransferase, partial [Bradymonadaceae bacterium]